MIWFCFGQANNSSRRIILKIELELNNLNSILSRSAVTPVFPSLPTPARKHARRIPEYPPRENWSSQRCPATAVVRRLAPAGVRQLPPAGGYPQQSYGGYQQQVLDRQVYTESITVPTQQTVMVPQTTYQARMIQVPQVQQVRVPHQIMETQSYQYQVPKMEVETHSQQVPKTVTVMLAGCSFVAMCFAATRPETVELERQEIVTQ